MDHSPANIIRDYLIDEALLTDPDDSGAWPAYIGNLPDGKDTNHNAVACIDTSPTKDGRLMGGTPLFHFGVQLLVRATDYDDGYVKASALDAALAAVDDDEVTIDSVTYQIVNVSAATGIVALGQEEGTKRRWMFSLNFLATVKEV